LNNGKRAICAAPSFSLAMPFRFIELGARLRSVQVIQKYADDPDISIQEVASRKSRIDKNACAYSI
jgi:hypothetical protein